MKKILLGLATVLCITSTAIAASTDKSVGTGYALVPYKGKAISVAYMPATNISVLNYSDNTIYISQPLYKTINSGKAVTITHSSFYGDTYLVLENMYHQPIFSDYVCSHAIVTVDEGRVRIEESYC